MSSITYRPEIDGLRAIAVLSVMIFHLNPSWLPGGFLGVDIFFVISGYLITSIISKEMQTGQFSFAKFYNRRIKRIYPAFILVMVIVSICSSFIFVRTESEQLRKTIELAFVFLSNFYLSYRQGYFDLSANENPIVHIWSLAVEEQYYLFFPVLLAFAYKKYQSTRAFKNIILGLFVFFILTSFIPNNVYGAVGLNNTYYISFIRFPELLIGSFLAYLGNKKFHSGGHQVLTSAIFLALLLTLFFYHKEMPLIPGVALILPCVLTSALIYYSATPSLVRSFLSLKPVVFIGKISYSLYLFHWIFISFTFYITGEKSLPIDTVLPIVALSFLAASLSYYLLEQPIRKSNLSFKQAFLFLYLIPSLLVFGYNFGMKGHIKNKMAKFKSITYEESYQPLDIESKVLTIGDSHADHLQEFLQYTGTQEGWKSDILNVGDCLLFVDENLQRKNRPECQTYVESINKYPVIFISLFYDIKRGVEPVPRFNPKSFIFPNFDKEFKALVEYLAKTKKVYVFADNISLSRSALRNIFLKEYGLDKYLLPIQELGDHNVSNKAIYELIKDIPNVKWVNPIKYLGQQIYLEGKPLYGDQDHFTPLGSYYMGKEFHKHERLLEPEEVKALYQ